MPPPLQVDNILAPVSACWLFKTAATSWPSTFWPWKWWQSHVWRGLPLCQFSLPRPLFSIGRMYVTDRQTDRRQTSDTDGACHPMGQRHNKIHGQQFKLVHSRSNRRTIIALAVYPHGVILHNFKPLYLNCRAVSLRHPTFGSLWEACGDSDPRYYCGSESLQASHNEL